MGDFTVVISTVAFQLLTDIQILVELGGRAAMLTGIRLVRSLAGKTLDMTRYDKEFKYLVFK